MQIDPNEYEQMISLGNQNQGLARQQQMIQMLRQGAPQPGGMDSVRGIPVAQSGRNTAINALTNIGGMAMQNKMGGQMDANKMQQFQQMLRMMKAGQGAGPVAGPGMMPPRPRNPYALGGGGAAPDPMYDLDS